jgi:hypothetical protein
MKQNLVSAAAVLICCAILGAVGVFGYSRYKAAQVENAAFRAQLQNGTQDPQALLGTHMPGQLPPGPNPSGEASPTPSAGQ